jgi:hypothetical protein
MCAGLLHLFRLGGSGPVSGTRLYSARLTVNVHVVYIARDVMILMRAVSIYEGPPFAMARVMYFPTSKSLSPSAI